MFLLVSVRHVGAHPDEHQHGVSIQISINLGKTFLRISRIRNIPLTWILARVFVYVPPFISQILDFIYWTVLIFILIYFEWRETENQQYPPRDLVHGDPGTMGRNVMDPVIHLPLSRIQTKPISSSVKEGNCFQGGRGRGRGRGGDGSRKRLGLSWWNHLANQLFHPKIKNESQTFPTQLDNVRSDWCFICKGIFCVACISARRTFSFLLPSSRAVRSFRASCRMPCFPRLVHKASVIQAIFCVTPREQVLMRTTGQMIKRNLWDFFFDSKTSIVVAADDSVVSWGPSPTYGELVRSWRMYWISARFLQWSTDRSRRSSVGRTLV